MKTVVFGGSGMVGSAIIRNLKKSGFSESDLFFPSRQKLDLTLSTAVDEFFSQVRPEAVVIAAGRVGGIQANNSYPVEFFEENMLMGLNIVRSASRYGVRRLVNLASSCTYPRMADQPMKEDVLMTGPLEPTNEAYAMAKLSTLKLCQFYFKEYGKEFVTAIPANLYGPGDTFDLSKSHVIPAMIKKLHGAKISGLDKVEFWGTGNAIREFVDVDDAAEAIRTVLLNYKDSAPINISSGVGTTMRDLAHTVAKVVGYLGKLEFDVSKPDGAPRRQLDSTKVTQLGWKPVLNLESGLLKLYKFAQENNLLS